MQNRGFIPILPVIGEDYIFGASKLGGEILVEDGQWDGFLPIFELQKNERFDSYSCVSYARNNCLETILKRKYKNEINYSDRFTSVMTRTVPRKGNGLKNGAERMRKTGNVLEEDYPSITPEMTETQFFTQPPQEIKNKGLQWLKDYTVGYEFTNNSMKGYMDINKAMEALKYSPLQTAIDSSTKHKSEFSGWNDSVMIHGYIKNKGWKVFGSYPQTTGFFDWDYPFFVPLRYELTKVIQLTEEDMKLQLIRNAFTGAIYLIDSDGKKHHIDAPDAFMEYFGEKAWKEESWTNVEPTRIDPVPEGKKLTLDKNKLSDALRELLKRFGATLRGN